jgi:AcrR family transcriptional regulator
MPFPAKVSTEALLNATRRTLEAEGLEALSLNKLAAEFNIKPASLYNHFPSKAALLRAINTQTNRELTGAMHDAVQGSTGDTATKLERMVHAYREYAHAHPVTYGLLFSSAHPELFPDAQESESLALPLQAILSNITGEDHSLAALRGLWALIHGFVVLELAGQFRRGGSLDAVFLTTVRAYLKGWER